MIVKNEEKFLENCLKSVEGLVEEIILVDTGSTDKTIDIGNKFGAKSYHFQWCDDFAAARNASLDKATCDWILVLDADEELDRNTIPQIKKTIRSSDLLTAYFIKVVNYLDESDDPANSTELRIVRLFPNRKDIRYKRLIHEEIYSEGILRKSLCDACIYHRGYTDKLHTERNKGERNVNLLLNSIKQEPDNSFHYYNLGVSYYVQDRLENSIEAFKTAQEKCDYPRTSIFLPSSYSLCAAALSRLGNYKEAKEQAEKGIALSPYFYEAYFNLGKAWVGLKETDKAIEAFKMALSTADKPQFAVMDRGTGGWKAYCELGLLHLNEDKLYDALRYFNMGLILLPNSTKLLINAAHCYRKLKFYEHAKDSFLRAHQIEPRRLDICYDLIELYDKVGLYEEVINLFEEMMDYYPSNKDLFFVVARRYDCTGNYKLAIHYYTQTLVLDEEDPSVYFYRARCYWHLGSTGKARKDLKRAHKLNSELLKGFTLSDFYK